MNISYFDIQTMSMGKVKCMRKFKRQIVKNTTAAAATPSAS